MPTDSPAQRKRVRLADVAKRSEISIGAASMALRGSARISAATRERVRAVCRELGYRPPTTTGKARREAPTMARIGLALVGRSVHDAVYASLLHELSSMAHERQFRLEVQTIPAAATAPALAARILDFAAPCTGVLLCGAVSAAALRLVSARHPRIVLMGLPVPDEAGPELTGERSGGIIIAGQDQAMGRCATQRLLAAGHRRIAFLTEVLRPGLSHARWREGYRLALADAGLPLDPALERITGNGDDPLPPVLAEFAALPAPPTAYVVADLRLAGLLLRHLAAAGRPVPHDALIAWGSPQVARLYGIADRAMIGIDVPQWVQAALACVQMPPAAGLAAGHQVLVPFVCHHLPPLPATS
jgi:DNA-binding LacI/PurR family transcriptional regulator